MSPFFSFWMEKPNGRWKRLVFVETVIAESLGYDCWLYPLLLLSLLLKNPGTSLERMGLIACMHVNIMPMFVSTDEAIQTAAPSSTQEVSLRTMRIEELHHLDIIS